MTKEEIERDFIKAQQEMIDSFKVKLTKAADEAISSLYTDTSIYHAIGDARTNFFNQLRDECYDEFKKDIISQGSHFSWAHSIRMFLLQNHKEDISNKIIEDLQDKVKWLEKHIEDIRKYR